MVPYICETCGVQYAPSDEPPRRCLICDDERQYVPPGGQRWTTLDQLRGRHRNILTEVEPDLLRIATEPEFGIGQHAYLVRTARGNLLWDCLTYLDDQTVAAVKALGGIAAIAISHPHFYGSCVEWSDAFDHAPVFLHAADQAFTTRPSPTLVHFPDDEVEPIPGLRVVRLGGHFHGSTVLHWKAGAEGRGVLLAGDTIALVADTNSVAFMYSYPNRIPLAAETVRNLSERILRYDFDRIYGPFSAQPMASNAKEAVKRSADRYIGMVEGTWPRS